MLLCTETQIHNNIVDVNNLQGIKLTIYVGNNQIPV